MPPKLPISSHPIEQVQATFRHFSRKIPKTGGKLQKIHNPTAKTPRIKIPNPYPKIFPNNIPPQPNRNQPPTSLRCWSAQPLIAVSNNIECALTKAVITCCEFGARATLEASQWQPFRVFNRVWTNLPGNPAKDLPDWVCNIPQPQIQGHHLPFRSDHLRSLQVAIASAVSSSIHLVLTVETT